MVFAGIRAVTDITLLPPCRADFYYALSSLKIRVPWKQLVTVCQITQVSGAAHAKWIEMTVSTPAVLTRLSF